MKVSIKDFFNKCGFGHIFSRNPECKTSYFSAVNYITILKNILLTSANVCDLITSPHIEQNWWVSILVSTIA